MKDKNLPKRLFIVVVGLILVGIGIGMLLFSDLGVDPGSVFVSGVSNTFSLSYGFSSALVNALILLIVFFIDKKYINIASVLAMITIGYTADFANMLVSQIIPDHFIIRFLMIFVGCATMSLGIATYLGGNLGGGAIDLIGLLISEKKNIKFDYVRIASDVTFVVAGFALGGKVGIATLILAFLTGPLIELFRPYVHKIINQE